MTPARIVDLLRSHPLVSASAAVILAALTIYLTVGPADNLPDDYDDDFLADFQDAPIGGRHMSRTERDSGRELAQPHTTEGGSQAETGGGSQADPHWPAEPALGDGAFSHFNVSGRGGPVHTAGFETKRPATAAAWLTGTIEEIDVQPAVPARTASAFGDGPISSRHR